jgi:cyclohexadienyl dehydratase
MITDAVETRVRAKLHPGVLCPVHSKAPLDHSELAYWMPRDPISAAYVNQWLNLLDLSGDRQAILARWMPEGTPTVPEKRGGTGSRPGPSIA